jgi:hypothetical protein
MDRAREIKRRHDARLMGIDGVVGTGVSLDEDGNPVIQVYVLEGRGSAGSIPRQVEGVPVQVVVEGPFEAR